MTEQTNIFKQLKGFLEFILCGLVETMLIQNLTYAIVLFCLRLIFLST